MRSKYFSGSELTVRKTNGGESEVNSDRRVLNKRIYIRHNMCRACQKFFTERSVVIQFFSTQYSGYQQRAISQIGDPLSTPFKKLPTHNFDSKVVDKRNSTNFRNMLC